MSSAIKIWRLVEPINTIFAQCWLRSPAVVVKPSPCKSCEIELKYEHPSPLVLEWETGSDKVGDFVWPSGGRVAAKKSVLNAFAQEFPNIEIGPVEMVQDASIKPQKKSNHLKPRVWLPYEGPLLEELIVNHTVPLLPDTTAKVIDVCNSCGRKSRILLGVETQEYKWDISASALVEVRKQKEPGKGIFVARSNIESHSFFRIEEFSSAIFCTNDTKRQVEKYQLTNISFLEYGDLI
jgi:hypothetical protein